jgi:hypothetical protein
MTTFTTAAATTSHLMNEEPFLSRDHDNGNNNNNNNTFLTPSNINANTHVYPT